MLERNVYAALYSRIQTGVQLQIVTEHARFAQLINDVYGDAWPETSFNSVSASPIESSEAGS